MRRRRFADRAGYTRHCWECLRSKGWQQDVGWCGRHGMLVGKYDSPANCASVAAKCADYAGGGR